jgi:hypothetical protein
MTMVKKAMKKGMKAMMRMKKMKMTMAMMEVYQPNFFLSCQPFIV